ncbi:hypothetical protein [Okeania sp. KiyG1]
MTTVVEMKCACEPCVCLVSTETAVKRFNYKYHYSNVRWDIYKLQEVSNS